MVTKKKVITLESEALSMYLQGVKIKEIAKQLSKHNKTICLWKKKYNWEEIKEKLNEEAVKNARESLDQRRERMLKIARAMQSNYAKQLYEKKTKVNANEAIKAMDFEAKLEGLMIEKIEHSGNVTSVEINIIEPNENNSKLSTDDKAKLST